MAWSSIWVSVRRREPVYTYNSTAHACMFNQFDFRPKTSFPRVKSTFCCCRRRRHCCCGCWPTLLLFPSFSLRSVPSVCVYVFLLLSILFVLWCCRNSTSNTSDRKHLVYGLLFVWIQTFKIRPAEEAHSQTFYYRFVSKTIVVCFLVFSYLDEDWRRRKNYI